MKINVTLHSSIPTETGAWLKVGLDVLELDTEQDIEAQTSEALETWIKVTRKLNDGMLEQVEAMLIDPDSNPETIKNHFEDVKKRLGTMESIVPKIVTKVSELSKFHVDEKPKTEGK